MNDNNYCLSFPAKEGRYFIQESIIGTGSFGKVVDCYYSHYDFLFPIEPIPMVAKIIPMKYKKLIEQEIFMNKYIASITPRSPYIIYMNDYFLYENNMYILMEKVYGKTLFKNKQLKTFTDKQLVKIFIQMAKAVQFLHEYNIAHLDIKVANFILTEEGLVKLFDFGFSSAPKTKYDRIASRGTPDYVSPEILQFNVMDPRMSDIFALGICFYHLLLQRNHKNIIIYEREGKECSVDSILNCLSGHYIRDIKRLPRIRETGLFQPLIRKMVVWEEIDRPKIDKIIEDLVKIDDVLTF